MTYYKVLNLDLSCCYGGYGQWVVGEPMPRIDGDLVPCQRGYHVLRADQLIFWLGGPAIHPLTGVDEDGMIVQDDKCVVRQATLEPALTTWNERSARLLACDCAERVVHLAKDNRANEAIRMARMYADGQATKEELAASRAIAWDPAGAAVWNAGAAARAVWNAGDAARNARAAAGAAAGAVAWDAERHWQTGRLWQYLKGAAA